MKDGDIEIQIEKKYYCATDGGGLREKLFCDAHTNYGIGTAYTYHWTNTIYIMDKYIMDKYVNAIHPLDVTHKFHENGAYASWIRRYFMKKDKIHYSHSWWTYGGTSTVCFFKNGRSHSVSLEYNEDGRLRNKVYYTADGEKDHVLCYWNGPRLPSSADGAILRKAIPIVNRLEAEKEKGRAFNLATLEDAVLREEDVDTL